MTSQLYKRQAKIELNSPNSDLTPPRIYPIFRRKRHGHLEVR